MRAFLFGIGAALALAAAGPPSAEAAGCLKGAAVGGVAGHEVGSGHGVAGAGIGCAVGHHEAKKKSAKKAEQASQNHPAASGDAGNSGSSGDAK
ncbi:MAG: hypothetical protein JWL84_3951 [Rhodospirillales bacterium]|nr:hypothetical protein [Rhodospirillales bacterium]